MRKIKQYVFFISLFFLQEVYFFLEVYKKFGIGEDNLTQHQIKNRLDVSYFQLNLERVLSIVLISFIVYLLYLRLKRRKQYFEYAKLMIIYTILVSIIILFEVFVFHFTIGYLYINMHLPIFISGLLFLDYIIMKVKSLFQNNVAENCFKFK